MNTSVKIAALVSVLIFGAIIGVGIFFSDTASNPDDSSGGISYTEGEEKPAGTDSDAGTAGSGELPQARQKSSEIERSQ